MRLSIAALVAFPCLALTACSAPPDELPAAADLILHGGVCWTGDPEQSRASAVAIRGTRIAAVGSDEEVLRLRGPQTRTIDLAGRFVTPGFIDTHVHFASAARFLEFNIMETQSQEELVERVRRVVGTLEPGQWITGGFWGAYDAWAAGSAGGEARQAFVPDLSRIAELTADFPLFIRKFDDSAFAANAAALRAIGLDPEHPQAAGVTFEQNTAGHPTGIFHGPRARELFAEALPEAPSFERRLAQTRHALDEIRRHGVTMVSDMSDDQQLAIYRELRQRGELTTRIDFRYPIERWGELAEQGIRAGSGDAWIRLGGLKGHVDGIMGRSTARFFEPYEGQGENRGAWRHLLVDEAGDFVGERFRDLMIAADAAGLQLTIHAIGDEANRLLLDYLEAMRAANGSERDRRFRLVHAQVLHDDDFPRLGELGVIAEVQPYHLSDDMRWMEERIGHERCRGAYAFRRLRDSGARLAFGTDWPGTSASSYPIDPMLPLYAAVSRQTVTGEPAAGWFPDERLSIEDALKASTLDAAYALFAEDELGSLTAGKLADIVVLSRNLLEIEPAEILETETLLTILDGEIVYEAEPFS